MIFQQIKQKTVEILSKNSAVPIKYMEHNMGGRGSISKNLAAPETKGDYIAFLDDDHGKITI